MNISHELLDELIAHALEDPRNEVCGVVAVEPPGEAKVGMPAEGVGARAVRVLHATNIHASPLKFEIDPDELLKLWNACQAIGDMGAIYHSHVRSKPYPSQTDVKFAANWPGLEWIIIGLTGDWPEVRSYLIEDGTVREVELLVEGTS